MPALEPHDFWWAKAAKPTFTMAITGAAVPEPSGADGELGVRCRACAFVCAGKLHVMSVCREPGWLAGWLGDEMRDGGFEVTTKWHSNGVAYKQT